MLLDAAYELLGTEGSAGTSVRAVCQRAALNPRYFYESFEDLDALLIAVYDRLVEQLGQQVLAAVEATSEDPRDRVRAVMETTVAFVDDDRRRGRILYVEALGSEALNRRRIETSHALVGMVERAGAERNGSRPPGEHIATVAAAILVGGSAELVAAWLDGRIDATRDELIDDATELFLAVGDAAARIAGRRARQRRRPAT